MTKIQNPLIGRASGKAGGMIFYKQFSANVMRSAVFEYRASENPASQVNRSYFTSIMAFIKAYLAPFLSLLVTVKPTNKSPQNLLFSQLAAVKVMTSTIHFTDFSKLFTIGSGVFNPIVVTYSHFRDNVLLIWHDPSTIPAQYLHNHLVFFGINFTQQDSYMTLSLDFAEESTQVPITRPHWLDTDQMVFFVALNLVPGYAQIKPTQFSLISTFNI